jgi:non-ribosomal peptide synthase protein (TIGR01720 family)
MLVNHYGPTEYSVVTTAVPVEPATTTTPPPIGRPIDNTQLYILDANLQPVPIGMAGELYIGGDGLARGYLHRPALTAERFVPNPFGAAGTRLYRTGDLVKYQPDGNVEFLGRIDHQVKIRGYRIELGEIESVLGSHPAVAESAVVAQQDAVGGKRLVAYVVLRPPVTPPGELAPVRNGATHNGAVDTVATDSADHLLEQRQEELYHFLRKTLPDYMAPTQFVFLDALPLTPNGKIDRKALVATADGARWQRPPLNNQYVAPRTAAEEQLAAIWCAVLGMEQVGVHDNFFALGGDSIRSIQVTSKANQAGLHLTTTQLFENPTVAQLVTQIGDAAAVVADEATVTELLPLTPIQHWFFAQNHPDPHHWNWSFLYEVAIELEVALLAEALQRLIAHHDALRLRFQATAQGWRQRVAEIDADPPLTVIDLSMAPAAQLRQQIERAAAHLQTSLDLTEGPLLRLAYFRCGADQPDRLMIIFHHLIVDPVSVHYLWEDLQTVYAQLMQRQTPQLPPKTTPFSQWAQRLARYAQSSAVREELDYWVCQLQAGRGSTLPLDYPDGLNRDDSSAIYLAELDERNTRALLQSVPAACGVQINELLLTALVRLYADWSGNTNLLVNLMGHGREELFAEVDVARTVGWFVNIYPLLVDLSATPTAVEALLATRAQLRAVPQRGMGYGLLRYLCTDEAVAQQMRALPTAEIAFNYQGQWDLGAAAAALPLREAEEAMGPQRSPAGMREHVLTIESRVVDRQLYLYWHYSRNLHDPQTIERLAQRHLAEVQTLINSALTADLPPGSTAGPTATHAAQARSKQPA